MGEPVLMEPDHRALRSGIQLRHIGGPAEILDRDHAEQVFDLDRQRAEPVDHFGGKAVDILHIALVADPTIERQAHIEVLNIAFRDHHRHAEIDLRAPALAREILDRATVASLFHGLTQHLLVQLDTHFLDMAGLFLAEQVAGTANVEVIAGKREPGP